jgi:hypothetical protein
MAFAVTLYLRPAICKEDRAQPSKLYRRAQIQAFGGQPVRHMLVHGGESDGSPTP